MAVVVVVVGRVTGAGEGSQSGECAPRPRAAAHMAAQLVVMARLPMLGNSEGGLRHRSRALPSIHTAGGALAAGGRGVWRVSGADG